MTDASTPGADAADGADPVQTLLLGFANQIDQLAGLVAGIGGPATGSSPIPELLGELGTLVKEFGDLLARLIAAFIAVLEAIAEMLRSDGPAQSPVTTHFQPIAVNIAPEHP
ncbi:hypothetical protein [Gordonia hydrophobica]|uniref:Uncharacterized protein n=1 Tax=Gordonia hydrophobica TaxID=40516 RepID=A0ABZ2TYI7_9ACTN|nr:hypothetical protein [Gordonia hydrophobica]MBM7367089.1 hypothetical protein [Gordonia hydrophobica]